MNKRYISLKSAIQLLCGMVVLLAAVTVWADNFDEDDIIPTKVGEIVSPLEHPEEEEEKEEEEEVEEIEEEEFWERIPSLLKKKIRTYSPFLRDTKLDFRVRTLYTRKEKNEDSDSDNAAVGVALLYHSGWFYDRLAIGAALYTSQPLYNSGDSPAVSVMTLGQAYGRVKLMEGTMANLYRYGEFNTPYLSKNDSKLIPYSFEGYTLTGRLGGAKESYRLDFDGGYLLKIKDKTAENFIWMSEKAGATVKRGVAMLGFNYFLDGFSLAAIDYYSDDIINIAYTEPAYKVSISNDLNARFAAQVTDQRSVGRNLLKGYAFSVSQVGIKSDLGYHGSLLTLAYTANGTGADLINPWSGCPGYTSAIVNDYNSAGENALYAKLAYDFSRVGLTGVTASVAYAHGWGKISATSKAALPDSDEFDADILWQLKKPSLWLRARFGMVHQYEAPRQYSYEGRVSLYYDFPLL